MESIILLGFGGHARSVADSIIQSGQFHIEGYTGDRPEDCSGGFRWLGTDSSLEKHYKSGIHNAFISIGYMGGGGRQNMGRALTHREKKWVTFS